MTIVEYQGLQASRSLKRGVSLSAKFPADHLTAPTVVLFKYFINSTNGINVFSSQAQRRCVDHKFVNYQRFTIIR